MIGVASALQLLRWTTNGSGQVASCYAGTKSGRGMIP
jgi:hypothetical protein